MRTTLASRPAELNAEEAMRTAATKYDDAAAARIFALANTMRKELQAMHSEPRARAVRAGAIARIGGLLLDDHIYDATDQLYNDRPEPEES